MGGLFPIIAPSLQNDYNIRYENTAHIPFEGMRGSCNCE